MQRGNWKTHPVPCHDRRNESPRGDPTHSDIREQQSRRDRIVHSQQPTHGQFAQPSTLRRHNGAVCTSRRLVPLSSFVAPRTPRATIVVDSAGRSTFVWNVTDDGDDGTELDKRSSSSVQADALIQPAAQMSKSARLSIGGLEVRPIIHRRDRICLLLLRSLLAQRVRDSMLEQDDGDEHPNDGGRAEQADGNDEQTDSEAVSENRPTMSLFPKADASYVCAPRNSSTKIYHSLSASCATTWVLQR